jgi:hypothetical protein
MLIAVVCCLGLLPTWVNGQGLYRPNVDELRSMKEAIEAAARERAALLAARAAADTIGSLSPKANLALRHWSDAVDAWKREERGSAKPLLAEGVLLDCLGRMQGIKTRLVLNERAQPSFQSLAAERPGRAARAFERALEREPDLIEARFRLARIRALEDAEPRALRELEDLAGGASDSPFTYLAAVSRAEAARAGSDRGAALFWYRRAIEIYPPSAAAAFGLASIEAGRSIAFETLAANDVYYGYPCTILTASVHSEMSERVRAAASK